MLSNESSEVRCPAVHCAAMSREGIVSARSSTEFGKIGAYL